MPHRNPIPFDRVARPSCLFMLCLSRSITDTPLKVHHMSTVAAPSMVDKIEQHKFIKARMG